MLYKQGIFIFADAGLLHGGFGKQFQIHFQLPVFAFGSMMLDVKDSESHSTSTANSLPGKTWAAR